MAKELRDEIWDKFKAASATVNKRYQAYFEERKAREAEAEAAKEALCEQVEAIDTAALNGFSAWDKATATIQELQAKWKELGYASRRANRDLFGGSVPPAINSSLQRLSISATPANSSLPIWLLRRPLPMRPRL